MSLVKNIKKLVYEEIRRRPYKAGEKLPGVRELAETCDVSYVTMSNALAMLAEDGIIEQFPGKGTFVTEMASKNTLALFVPDYLIGLRPFNPSTDSTCLFGLMDVYAGLLASIQREGFNLHVIPVAEADPDNVTDVELISEKLNLAGGFFMALSSNKLIERFSHTKRPCCKLHTPGESLYNYVSVDMEKGVFKIIEHLIKLGHKRIAFISGKVKNPWFEGRYSGYRKALEKHNIKYESEFVAEFPGDKINDNALNETLDKFFSKKEAPTALFATSDRWALQIMRILKAKGFDVPEKISVAGFDDYAESRVSDPPLTTVAQPFYEIGEEAFLLMKKLLLSPSEKMKSIIEPSLIIRKSTDSPDKTARIKRK